MTEHKTHKITLRNRFHGTSVTVLVPTSIRDQHEAWLYLQEQANFGGPTERRRLARVRRALCPLSTCKCGALRPK
jgi:hypothetical protein